MLKVVLDTNVLVSGVIASGNSASIEPISVDRDDDFVLACAADERADAIVSGDPHLLALENYQNIPILTPREFVTRFLKR